MRTLKSTPATTPSELDRAYLAGIIDGEGSISANMRLRPRGIAPRRWGLQLRVTISNTDVRVINWIAERWPGRFYPREDARENKRVCWYFVVEGTELPPLLSAALPYLIIKREQAELVMELVRAKRDVGVKGYTPEEINHRLDVVEQISELNRKGSKLRGRRHDGLRPRPSGQDAAAEI